MQNARVQGNDPDHLVELNKIWRVKDDGHGWILQRKTRDEKWLSITFSNTKRDLMARIDEFEITLYKNLKWLGDLPSSYPLRHEKAIHKS